MASYPNGTGDGMDIPPPIPEAVTGGGLAALWALLGRAMYRAQLAASGRRAFFDKTTIYELPIAIGTGLIGQGVADYFGLVGFPAVAVIVTAGHLGPRVIEAAVLRIMDRIAPAKETK